MNPTIIGQAGSLNVFATNEQPIDMQEARMKSFAKATALTTIMMRMNREKAHNLRVDLTEEHEIPIKVTVAAEMAASGSTLNIAAFGITLVKDTILWNPDVNEWLNVTANATTNAIAVENHSGTAAIWKLNDEVIVLLPKIAEDDSLVFRLSSVVDTNIFNYTQLSRLQFGINRKADAQSTHFGGAGSKRKQLQAQKFREFKLKDEQQKWFGVRTSSGSGSSGKWGANGIATILRDGTNFKDFGGVFTESGWDNYLGSFVDENPDADDMNLFFFGAPKVIRHITGFAKDKIRINPGTKTFGLKLDTYRGDIDIKLVRTPIFNNTATTKGYGFILDMSRIKLKELSPLTLHKDAYGVGQSEKIIDTYRADDTIMLANENKHSMMVNAYL